MTKRQLAKLGVVAVIDRQFDIIEGSGRASCANGNVVHEFDLPLSEETANFQHEDTIGLQFNGRIDCRGLVLQAITNKRIVYMRVLVLPPLNHCEGSEKCSAE